MTQCGPILSKGISECSFYPKSRILFDKFSEEKLKDIINKKWFFDFRYTKDYISDALKQNAYIIIL